MRILASSIIDLKALWKIVAISVFVGAGVVGAFGFALLGVSRYQQAQGPGLRATSALLVAIGAGLCLAAIVIGLIAMTRK